MEEKKEMVEKVEESSVEEHTSDVEVESAEEVEAVSQESGEESAVETKKMKKHDEATVLVNEAKAIVDDADKQTEECRLLLSDDLKSYEEAKEALISGGLDASEAMLEALGYREGYEELEEEETLLFEPKEEMAPMVVKEISSGRFTGFFLSLIGGTATLAGLGYIAAQKSGVTFDRLQLPSPDAIQTMLGWFGTLVGQKESVATGGAVVAAAVLVVMVILYLICVSSKGSKNLNFAVQQLEEAERYAFEKGNCKAEMDRVDAHIHEAIETLNIYRVLLNEQKGKLQRILHIEGEKEDGAYHEKSIVEIKDTQALTISIRKFITMPMSEQGRLSEASRRFLHNAKSKMEKILERLY